MRILVPLIWIAGAVHLSIAVSNFWVPGLFHYRENLVKLSAIVRQVFIVHSIYMVLVLLGFSGLCFFFAPQLAGGSSLGRALSGFLAIFWLLRVGLQFGFYDKDVRARHRLGDVAYTFATICLAAVFSVAALGVVK
jgi:hypothetical protein